MRVRKVLVIAVLLATASPASAQVVNVCTPENEALHQPEPQDSVQEDLYKKRRVVMARIDANCDGIINANEWTAAIGTMFQAADVDHDGKLSPSEQQTMIAAYAAKTEKIIGATKIVETREIQTSLHMMDKDGDGVITANEYEDYYSGVFKNMDKNGDNNIDIDGFREGFEGVRRVRN